jgi:hypothetical protein
MATSLNKVNQVDFARQAVKAQDMDLSGNADITGTLAVTGAVTLTGGNKLAPVAIPDGATYAVLAANSGKIHIIPDLTADCTITLPAAAAGLNYEFWYGGAAADAQDWIIVPTAGFYIGGVVFHDQDGDVSATVFSDGNSNDVLNVLVPEAGTCIKVVSDGTNWYLNGWVHAATVPTLADS